MSLSLKVHGLFQAHLNAQPKWVEKVSFIPRFALVSSQTCRSKINNNNYKNNDARVGIMLFQGCQFCGFMKLFFHEALFYFECVCHRETDEKKR